MDSESAGWLAAARRTVSLGKILSGCMMYHYLCNLVITDVRVQTALSVYIITVDDCNGVVIFCGWDGRALLESVVVWGLE